MKKLMALVLSVVCMLGLIGCSNTSSEKPTDTIETTVPTATSTPGVEQTENDNEIPGRTIHVVDIWDQTTREQLLCASALEKFWEDETNEYYFSCIKSHYIMVMDGTGRTVDVVTALEEGLITIETLDSYGIKYDTKPKS